MIWGMILHPDGDWRLKEFGEPLHKTLGAAVGGYIEVVRPRGLPAPFVLIVNEEGRLLGLPVNPDASELYGFPEHGQPIVGTVVFLREEQTPEGMELAGLQSRDLRSLLQLLVQARGERKGRRP